jgi:hypothetical protein
MLREENTMPIGYFVLTQLASWVYFFSSARSGFPPATFIAIAAFSLATSITLTTVWLTRKRQAGITYNNWIVALAIVNNLVVITVLFAALYWAIGTTANFTFELSRVDAIYFALGTLTTAGTGTIAPTSGFARAFVSGQLILDLLFAGVAVTLAVARWSEKSD